MIDYPRHLARPKHARGRGALSNVGSRYEPTDHVSLDDGWGALDDETSPKTEVTALSQKSLITYNTSPDLSFDRTINPYKGCEHGCIYCYARPNHAYLGLSPGLDFERKIFSKPNSEALLRAELAKRGYRPRPIILGGDTDPYQPAERRLGITRQILDVLVETRHPVGIVSKSELVTRDLDLLSELAQHDLVTVAISITTLDRKLARALEPRASTPQKRLNAIEQLSNAGIPVRVMTAPIVPGLTDHELENLLVAAADHGAIEAGYVLLRLPLEIKDLFREWLEAERPAAAKRVLSLMREARAGRLYQAEFGTRQRGTGAYADLIRSRFERAVKRIGLNANERKLSIDLFRRPAPQGQNRLFD